MLLAQYVVHEPSRYGGHLRRALGVQPGAGAGPGGRGTAGGGL